jgi:hypothetical protein
VRSISPIPSECVLGFFAVLFGEDVAIVEILLVFVEMKIESSWLEGGRKECMPRPRKIEDFT